MQVKEPLITLAKADASHTSLEGFSAYEMHSYLEDKNMVYGLDMDDKPLMPTERQGKVRHLLKERKAKVVKKIRLLRNCSF